MNNRLTPNNSTVMILGGIGFIVGNLLIRYDFSSNECSKNFTEIPSFVVWHSLISFQTSVWFIFTRLLYSELIKIKDYFSNNHREIFLSIFVLTILFFGSSEIIRFDVHSPLQGHSEKILILTLMGFMLIAAPACIGVWLVHAALRKIRLEENLITREKIVDFFNLRDRLNFFLFIAGTGIGAAHIGYGCAA